MAILCPADDAGNKTHQLFRQPVCALLRVVVGVQIDALPRNVGNQYSLTRDEESARAATDGRGCLGEGSLVEVDRLGPDGVGPAFAAAVRA